MSLLDHTVLLERDESTDSAYGGYVSFSATDNVIWLGRQEWDDMGRPSTVTVSVRPGDHLNGGAS